MMLFCTVRNGVPYFLIEVCAPLAQAGTVTVLNSKHNELMKIMLDVVLAYTPGTPHLPKVVEDIKSCDCVNKLLLACTDEQKADAEKMADDKCELLVTDSVTSAKFYVQPRNA